MKTAGTLFPLVDHASETGCRRLVRRFLPLTTLLAAVGTLVAACASFEETPPAPVSASMMSRCHGPMGYQYPDCEPD